MSISLTVYGTEIDSLLSRFGSGDQEFLSSFRNQLDADKFSILEKAVRQGVPLNDLAGEGWSHVALMRKLFQNYQITIGEVDFRYTAMADILKKDLIPNVEPRFAQLLNLFLKGRPVFAPSFDIYEAFYSYLTLSETRELQTYLQQFKLPPPGDPAWDDLPLEMLDASYGEFTSALADLVDKCLLKALGLAVSVG